MNNNISNNTNGSSKRPQHDRSKYLKDYENTNLIQLIEKEDGVTLATATIQLWLSQKPLHNNWSKGCSGIICFVKDYTKKSYFFRLYTLAPSQVWEQEMYTPFSYNQLTKNFHYFPADDCNAGFNFSFEDEAEKFYNTVINKIMSKTKKTNRTSLAPVASVTHPATQSPSSTSKHNNNNNRNYHSNTTQSTSYLPNYTTNLTLNPQLSNTSLNSTGSSSDQHSNKNGTVKTKKKVR